MKLKSFMSAALAVVVSSGAFTACTNKDDVSNYGVKTVTIWGNGAGTNVDADIAENFNKTIGKEKGIRIDYQVKEGDLQQQIEIALQSGKAPDLFGAAKLKEFAEKKYIAPITDFKGGQEFINESIKDGGLFEENTNVMDGKPYTVSTSIMTLGLIYNKDMFKKAGLVDKNGDATPPETWDELREYSKKLTDKSKRQYGIILPMKWAAWFDYDIRYSAVSSAPNMGFNTETMQCDYSQMNGILNTLVGLKEDGSCYPGAEGIDNDPARARFAEGKIGMKISMSWDVGVFKEQFPANFDWGVAPIPTYSKTEKYPQFEMKQNGMFINATVLGTEREEAVFEVWKYWHGKERARKLYEEGISLPVNFNTVKDIETDIKGWKEFAQMQEISNIPPKGLPSVITGKKTLSDLFINDVWNGSMTVEEATSQYTKTVNEGIDKYYEQNKSADRKADMALVTKNSPR